MISYNLSGSCRSSQVVRGTRQLLILALSATSAIALSSLEFSAGALAKTPGKTYCFRGTCHRVKTLSETKALVGRDIKISASFYDACTKDRFNNCGLTSSGEVYKPNKADNAASSILPDGTVALVWSETTGEALVLRINNAGPYWGNRKLDLSAAAARKLGIAGVEDVTVRIVKAPTEGESRYEKNRSYDPVIGPLGKFASLDLAQKAMSKIRSDGLKHAPTLANLDKPHSPSVPDFDLASLGEPVLVSAVTYEQELRGRGLSLSRDNGGIKLLKPNGEFSAFLDQVKLDAKYSESIEIYSESLKVSESEKSSTKGHPASNAILTAELTDTEAHKFFVDIANDASEMSRDTTTPEKSFSLFAALSSLTFNNFYLFDSASEQSSLPDFPATSLQVAALKNKPDTLQVSSRKNATSKKAEKRDSSVSEASSDKKSRSDVKIASLASSATGEGKGPSSPTNTKKLSSPARSKKKET